MIVGEPGITQTMSLGDDRITEPARARESFGALLGWTYAEISGIGDRVQDGAVTSVACST